jgi:hypothetical protein
MNPQPASPEWRQALSLCLIDLKTIIGNSDAVNVTSGNYGHRPRFVIDGEDISHIATALGLSPQFWYETRYYPGEKPQKRVAVHLQNSEFEIEELYNFYPDEGWLKALRVKDYRGYLEIEIDIKSSTDAWTERLSYSGRYSIEWPMDDVPHPFQPAQEVAL